MIINNIQQILNKLNEEWFATIKSNWKKDNSPVEVFKNPSKSEVIKLTKGSPQRFILDVDGNVYMWDGNTALHDEVAQQLKIAYRLKGAYFSPDYIEFFKSKNPQRNYDLLKDSHLEKLLNTDYKDNQLRR